MQQQVLSRVNRNQEALQYNLTTSEDLAIFFARMREINEMMSSLVMGWGDNVRAAKNEEQQTSVQHCET